MIEIPYIAILTISYVGTNKNHFVTNVALLLLACEQLDLKAFRKLKAHSSSSCRGLFRPIKQNCHERGAKKALIIRCPEHKLLALQNGVLKKSI